MRVKLVSVVALFVLLLGACSVPKDVVYFQGVDTLTPEQVSKMNQAYTSKICPDDLLTITVTAWDPTVVTPFNPPVYAYATQGETTTVSSGQLRTYLVDQEPLLAVRPRSDDSWKERFSVSAAKKSSSGSCTSTLVVPSTVLPCRS